MSEKVCRPPGPRLFLHIPGGERARHLSRESETRYPELTKIKFIPLSGMETIYIGSDLRITFASLLLPPSSPSPPSSSPASPSLLFFLSFLLLLVLCSCPLLSLPLSHLLLPIHFWLSTKAQVQVPAQSFSVLCGLEHITSLLWPAVISLGT